MAIERFVYYRVAAGSPSLGDELLAMQTDLRARHPQLAARLLRRAGDDDAAAQTWMEIYACPGGVDDALLAEIDRCAVDLLGPRLVGERHVESFEPCAS